MKKMRAVASYEHDPEFFIAGQSLVHATFKHLTTLSTGSILLLIALLEKLFTNPEWKALVAVSFVGFVVSIAASIVAMWIISAAITEAGSLAGLREHDNNSVTDEESIQADNTNANLSEENPFDFAMVERSPPLRAYVGISLMVASYVGFLLGVTSLVIFALKNFF